MFAIWSKVNVAWLVVLGDLSRRVEDLTLVPIEGRRIWSNIKELSFELELKGLKLEHVRPGLFRIVSVN